MAAGNLVQGALFTVMVVRAGMLRDAAFEHELARQIERSPRFFLNAPVVLDLKGAEGFADVNEFAEVRELLRGRASAGATGDAGARIFCSRLEAELVSIAGRYLISEQFPAEQQGFPVQIALVDDQLTITRN